MLAVMIRAQTSFLCVWRDRQRWPDDNSGRSLVGGGDRQVPALLLPLVVRRTVPAWPEDSSLYPPSLSNRAPEGLFLSCCGEEGRSAS
jgi:hypothetical protein